ncbi:hypothetical protein [Pseudoalteromonas sp. McH1-42]|uniref:hypothetical protein n=1 Tax=Pseudoalteromonas sp. McH1-42 TaxID=2917752 RepID=UPI001EF468EF|nr:hypothetical protein [Pseudoalteromonas sp. McH1-42]MCG7560344.1 hypothetical protein [Pseudoalteromonas sp. McH1-42]
MKSFLILLLSIPGWAIGNQLLTNEDILEAEQPIYWHVKKLVTVNEAVTHPLLFEFTSKGNGSVKVKHGQWIKIYDCHDNGYLYSPCLMNQVVKDVNSDGYNDVVFESELIYTGEKESDPRIKMGRVFVELVYSKKENGFTLGNYSTSIKPYEYYEE